MSPAVRPVSPSLALLVAPNGACCTSVVVVLADPRSRPSTIPTAAPAPMTAETAAIGMMLLRMEDEDPIPCLMRHEREVRIPKRLVLAALAAGEPPTGVLDVRR